MKKNNTVDIELLSRIDKDKVSLSAASFFDVLLIILMLFVLSSKFIISSGASIALNAKENDLPVSINSDMKGVLTSSELSILHIQSGNMILFDGAIYNMESFANALRHKGDLSQEVLLIKMDKNCDIQSFLNICEIAQEAGVKAVQIASLRAIN